MNTYDLQNVSHEVINNLNLSIISKTYEVVMKILPPKSNIHLRVRKAVKRNISAPQTILLSRNEKNVSKIFLQSQYKLNIETRKRQK